ncbi:hypothetical protein B0H19DRAFT_1080771 [Mycena capillaripes]|nr:hypothetical protein B0H19DRAFT_1080771 [Mycena capillaripes]
MLPSFTKLAVFLVAAAVGSNALSSYDVHYFSDSRCQTLKGTSAGSFVSNGCLSGGGLSGTNSILINPSPTPRFILGLTTIVTTTSGRFLLIAAGPASASVRREPANSRRSILGSQPPWLEGNNKLWKGFADEAGFDAHCRHGGGGGSGGTAAQQSQTRVSSFSSSSRIVCFCPLRDIG